jgi:serpin B
VLLLAFGPGLVTAEVGPVPTGKAAATASNSFAFDLYGSLGKKSGNLFFSPYSISTALAMTREGAKGSTATQIDKVFHWPGGMTPTEHATLRSALAAGTVKEGWGKDAKQVPAHEMHVANALWAQKGLPVEEWFTKRLEGSYGAPLRRIDFTKTAAARKIINDWVAANTKDRIRDIIPEDLPTPDTLFALANAIWFKAAWKDPFKEEKTKTASFTSPGEEIFEVALMHRTGQYFYTADDDVQVVEIPYRGSETSMIVVLPKKEDGLAAVEATLTAAKYDGWVGKLKRAHVSLKLPKFEITLPTDLTATLLKMGMPDAFDGKKADFTGMTATKPLFIGTVLHKAFVKVDEAGTEAAAATVVMMLRGGPPSAKPIEFTADHPFFFAIRHRKTGCILFAGRFTGP